MKILTPRNNKDYYDYLTGIYGVDEKVVYDRRQYTILSRLNHPLFSSELLEKDAPKKEKPSWKWKNKQIPEYEGTKFECLLEVGLKWFFFDVERYLDNDSRVCIDWKLIKEKEISKCQRVGSSPITFFTSYCSYGYYRRNIGILSGTPIPAFIKAEEIYILLSTYISSLNDIEIVDTRSDIQKAESAGFDRKTSFRNIK